MDKPRNYGYDVLRIIAISMVAIIHTNSSFLWNEPSKTFAALIMIELTGLCVSSVPLFFMISGALLLDSEKTVSIKDLYTKRILKQFIPFALWSILYTVIRIAAGKIPLSFSSFFMLFHEPAYSQFWFMYTLLGIYLLLPFLQILANKLTKNQFTYLLIIWFVFSVAVPLLTHYFPSFSISNHVDLVLSEGYIGYFLLGFYLKKYKSNVSGKQGLLLFAGGTVLTGVTVWIEWLNTKVPYAIRVGNTYGNYLLPGVLMSAIGLFVYFQNKDFSVSGRAKAVISKLSFLTMGVFYIHMLFVLAFEKTVQISGLNIIELIIRAILVIVASFVSIFVLSYIPYLNKFLVGYQTKNKEVKNDT